MTSRKRHNAAFFPAFAAALCAWLALAPGCARREVATKQSAPAPPRATLSEEIRVGVSRSVLEGVPIEGRLKKVRSSGILRVALPPANPPFQQRDAAGILYGFNIDLAEEIAGALLVKTNFVSIPATKIAAELRNPSNSPYDLVFAPPDANIDPAKCEPYFFSASPSGDSWLHICPSGPDDSLRRAVRNSLSYLNESGVFMRIRSTHFAPPVAAQKTTP